MKLSPFNLGNSKGASWPQQFHTTHCFRYLTTCYRFFDFYN